MFKAFRQLSLSSQIFAGLFAGLLFGLVLVFLANLNSDIANFIDSYLVIGFSVIKQLFMNALKMVVVPLVFVSLICGTCSLNDPKKLGSLAGASLSLYIFTTMVAITLALVLASFFEVGVGKEVSQAVFENKSAPSLVDVLSALIPSNPVEAMASGNMLQVIVFAILFGIAISRAGEKGKVVANFFEAMNHVILKLVTIIMHIAPYGVFAIMSLVIYNTGLDAILNLAAYFGIVILALLVHFSVTYTSLLVFFTGLNPLKLIIKMRPAMLLAFSTASSAATLPATMEVARKRLGIGKTTASFTLPMGATINMDGTAIMQGAATVFIAQISGIDLTMTQYITIILMATLASIGTAAVPSVGLLTLTMVLTQVNLPTEAIAMLLGIDRLLDMLRTVVNVTGDATVSVIVANREKDLCIETYNDPNAGLDFEDSEAAPL